MESDINIKVVGEQVDCVKGLIREIESLAEKLEEVKKSMRELSDMIGGDGYISNN